MSFTSNLSITGFSKHVYIIFKTSVVFNTHSFFLNNVAFFTWYIGINSKNLEVLKKKVKCSFTKSDKCIQHR